MQVHIQLCPIILSTITGLLKSTTYWQISPSTKERKNGKAFKIHLSIFNSLYRLYGEEVVSSKWAIDRS